MYYLQSRYYDPEVGRFLNADALISTGQGILGNNTYAYCMNNPVCCYDPGGTMAYYTFLGDSHVFSDQALMGGNGGARSGVHGGGCSSGGGKPNFPEIGNPYNPFNEDEQVVLNAEYFAFYKGVPVVKLPIGVNAFSFGVIFLGNEVRDSDTVQHEYGHSVHLSQIGIINYTTKAFLPSLLGFWSGVDYDKYYSQPWEYIAEVLGGVERTTYQYAPNVQEMAFVYWLYTIMP